MLFFFELLIYLVCSEHMLSICTCVAYAESSSGVEFTYTQHMLYVRHGSEFKVRPRSRSRPTPRKVSTPSELRPRLRFAYAQKG